MVFSAEHASNVIWESRHAIAELVLALMEESHATIQGINVDHTTQDLRERIANHMQSLAACIRYASPRLFADYVHSSQQRSSNAVQDDDDIGAVLTLVDSVCRCELPMQAATIVSEYVSAAVATDTYFGNAPIEPSHDESLRELQQQYLAAILKAHREEAVSLTMNAFRSGVDIESLYLDVFQRSLLEIGRLWQAGKITVAQEHYCTAATQFIMSQLQPFFMRTGRVERVLVGCCVGAELHEIGLRILTDLFEIAGWETVYLGANVPAESVVASVRACRTDVLAISTTMTGHLFSLGKTIAAVRADPDCREVKILVGGYPFNVDPFLWRRVGADGYARDAREALEAANRFKFPSSRAKSVGDPFQQTEVAVHQDVLPFPVSPDPLENLSQLNNQLITLQRQLTKANVKLRQLNEANAQKAAALKEADRRKDEFLAMLAHELRGPLSPINYAAETLRRRGGEPDVASEAYDTIQRQVRQMARLISDLLDASRIAHGRIELKLERLELRQIVARAVEVARPLIEEKQQHLKVEQSSILIMLEADEIRLTQVIANLLTNAAKYSNEGGTIRLSTSLVADRAIIEVRDNGIGIHPALLVDIFDTFSQEPRARKHSRGGLGLGLAVVKQLVELHGGSVKAASEGVGRGSVLTVSLPALESVECDRTPADTEREPQVPTPSRRVLVVDDTASVAQITSRLLQILGHQTVIALDGKSAIEKYCEFRPDIVILDLVLKEISGLDLAKSIRDFDRENAALIVALTGYDDGRHRQQAQDAGFDVYLVKPVDVERLERLASHPKLIELNDID